MNSRLDYTKISPAGVKAFGSVHGYIATSGLDPELVELVYLRVSQINGCAYCLDLHTRVLLGRNVSPQKLALLPAWRESGQVFSERERSALAWAESVTNVVETRAPDDAFQRVSAVFSDKELSDLTLAIALMNAYNRIAISLRRPPTAAIEAAAA